MNDSSQVADNRRKALLQDFKSFYQEGSMASLERIDRIYTQDIEFRDPLHTILGILALKGYMKNLYANSSGIGFEYTDEQSGENWATITWLMRFSNQALAGGKEVTVRGITQIRFTDRIYYHEDFYDLGAMIYQHLPVLGRIIRYINKRIGR
ncbi:MAG: nuclear transport factor 2 family protein [Gammaproteobacteria bacterium]|nr:nuclear transport factor 2 family protein [Gammaproteobacteria bacterium]MDP2141049.1 nuclear transport factor 2 family protein [Gammaproteobacteria bacterium]MDP2348507.1 nuclear transport factor 2 family protein [Gammaproteobacteria bacterium]